LVQGKRAANVFEGVVVIIFFNDGCFLGCVLTVTSHLDGSEVGNPYVDC
jgi:hypothetical protein